MREHPEDYIIEHYSFATLSLADILNHCSEMIDSGGKSFDEIQPLSIDINIGLFTHPSSTIPFPAVSVTQTDELIVVSCPCKTPKKKLCQHQAQVIWNILNRHNLRVFFDATLRLTTLKKAAKEYGMENEENLESHFTLEYNGQTLNIKPVLKELIKTSESNTVLLKEQLLPTTQPKRKLTFEESGETKTILVFRKHKYYDQLAVELYECSTSKDGNIKNPLVAVDAMELSWKAQHLDESKFFSAIAALQVGHNLKEAEATINVLKLVVKNPLQLQVFYHDKSTSENITATSITPISLGLLKPDLELLVFKKDPFYEVSGELVLNETRYPLKNLRVVFNYFIRIQNTLNLITDTDTLRVVEYFKNNNQKVIIHASTYDSFYKNILAKLEDRIRIDYSYIKHATPEQLIEQHFDQQVQKIIYLSDSDNYISITPVMKYGNIEVPVYSRKQVYDTDPNGNVFKVDRDDEAEIQFTSILLRQHPYFKEQMEEASYFYLHKSAFLDNNWFLDAYEEWNKQGILVLGFGELTTQNLNPNKATVSVKVNSGIDWFNTALTVTYGKQKAPLKQLYKAIRNKNKYVQLDDGTQGVLPLEWIERFEAYFRAGEISGDHIQIPKNNFTDIHQLFDDSMQSDEVKREVEQYEKLLASFDGLKDIKVPEALQATLRNYQLQGLKWLNFLDDFNFGACLADDMGLGKTIQIISFILVQRSKQKHNTNLVVVPTSLLFNWQAEVSKFAPSIKLFVHYGTNRVKDSKDFDQYEIILTTYGVMLSDINMLKAYRFNYIFLDESQAIKNPDSQRYKAARLLQSRNKIVLTGTPVENNTFDIYGQLSFACPGLLGNKQFFKDIYATPIDRFQNSKRATELQRKISPFILRRTKKEIAKELPEKTEMVIFCEMGTEQRTVYNAYEKELRDYLNDKTEDDLAKNSMHILTGLTKLRQICNSPSLVKGDEHLGDASSKIETLVEHIENKSPEHKILVFSQFVSMLDLIKAELSKRNINFEYLTGQTRNRAASVNAFQENKEVRVFLISLKAGGTGLNLTEADYVYIVDPWWNPAVENQAIDRCYRIGQEKKVIAVRLICPDTIEEKIMKLQDTKRKLVNDLIKTDNAVLRSFTKTDLLSMLS